jgi:hypothetical protein
VTRQLWDDDPALVGELREALAEREAVPPEFTAAGLAAFAWRTVDEELFLLSLSFDSSAPEGALATRAAPGDGGGRLLVFDAGDYRIDVELDGAGGLVGQITPAGIGAVRCLTSQGVFDEGMADEVGCFCLRAPAGGVVRLQAEANGRTVATDWINLGAAG